MLNEIGQTYTATRGVPLPQSLEGRGTTRA